MSNLKNTYGFSSSLLDAIRSVHETSNQDVEQIDEISKNAKKRYMGSAVADLTSRAYDHGVHTAGPYNRTNKDIADAKRKIKNRQVGIYRATQEEVELDEAVPYTLGGKPDKSNVYKVHRQDWKGNWSHNPGDTYHSLDDAKTVAKNMKKGASSTVKTKITKHARTKLAGPKGVLPEEVELDEGGMPSSVIRSKQKYAAMTNQEFADLHGHKPEEQLRQMAWSHGYGKMSPHYWNRVQKAKAAQMKEEVDLDEADQIDEISNKAKAKYLGRAVGDLTLRSQEHGFHTGANFYGKRTHPPHDYADAKRKIKNRQVGIYHATKNIAKEEVDLDEADHTYPFKANQLAPLVVQLRALLNFLSKSGSLKKSMREHAELVEAYIGEEITEERLEEMISFIDDLMEGRPKGSKNKSKMASAPKPEARSERGEASSSEEDDDYEDAHPTASRDGRHIIPELNGAAGDKKGDTVQTSGGQRHVPQHVATKMVSHLMSLKPAERAEHSAHIFNGSVPKVKTLNHVKTNVLIKQMGSEKKIGSGQYNSTK